MSPSKRNIFYFFIISFVLHALLALSSLLFKLPQEKPLANTTVEFEASESKTFVSRPHRSGSRNKIKLPSSTIHSSKTNNILFDDFKINMKNAGTAGSSGETILGEGSAPVQNNGAWVEQVDFAQGVELTAFFQQLVNKIDNALDYPEDIAKEHIQGDVRVNFYVNRKGQLLGDFHSVSGSQPLLNLYVMSSLLVLLKEPLPENLWSKEDGKIALSIHVHFEGYPFQEMQIRDSASFQSNELILTRARYVVPIGVEKTEKFFTRYMPPIIPIPGGFYVDLVMLTKYINNINTPDPDDNRRQKLLVTRERLELATKKKNFNL